MEVTLGLDCGIAHLGWSIWRDERLDYLGVIETAKDSELPASEDLFRRAVLLRSALDELVVRHAPERLVMESISWPRSGSVIGKMGVAYGVVASALARVPATHISPQAVRKALGLPKGKVNKDDMVGVVRDAPGCERLHELLDVLPRVSMWEHAVDACAVVLAARRLGKARAA